MVVVEVRQGAGGEETRRGEEKRGEEESGEEEDEKEDEEKEEDEDEEDEEEATDIKSNNPHLAGGEKNTPSRCPKTRTSQFSKTKTGTWLANKSAWNPDN